MKVQIKNLLQLFDEKDNNLSGFITSIVGVVGEDLATQIFRDYLIREKHIKERDLMICEEGSPNNGKLKGPRLDRWIGCIDSQGNRVLYQTEIKSWTAYAIKSKSLPVQANQEELVKYMQDTWKDQWSEHFDLVKNNKLNKVVHPMKLCGHDVLKGFNKEDVQPLVIYWLCLSADNQPFFSVPIEKINPSIKRDAGFKHIHFFSQSLYLRQLLQKGISVLDLDLARVQKQLELLAGVGIQI